MKTMFLCGLIFFFSCNSMAAVLYAGVPALDDGGGFISLSPLVDCIFWGAIAAVSGIIMLVQLVRYWKRGRIALPVIAEPFRFGASYLVTLCDLSLIVLLLGALGLLDRFGFGPLHLPFWGYVALLGVTYLAYGAFFGCLYPARPLMSLFGGALIAVLFALMAHRMLAQQAAEEAYWLTQNVNLVPAYTEALMDSALGAILGRLNLPACVLMDAYAYAYFDNLGGCHHFSREVMAYATSIAPPVVFTGGYIAGSVFSRSREKRN